MQAKHEPSKVYIFEPPPRQIDCPPGHELDRELGTCHPCMAGQFLLPSDGGPSCVPCLAASWAPEEALRLTQMSPKLLNSVEPLYIYIYMYQNCLQWGRSNLVEPAESPKICGEHFVDFSPGKIRKHRVH